MTKHSKLPGIRSLHDFIFTKNPATDRVLAKVRNSCYTEAFQNAPIRVVTGRDVTDSAIPNQESANYKILGKLNILSKSKQKNLDQMYKNFIPDDRQLLLD